MYFIGIAAVLRLCHQMLKEDKPISQAVHSS
jgi:hypothetical protein